MVGRLFIRMGNALIAFGNRIKRAWNRLVGRFMFKSVSKGCTKCKCK